MGDSQHRNRTFMCALCVRSVTSRRCDLTFSQRALSGRSWAIGAGCIAPSARGLGALRRQARELPCVGGLQHARELQLDVDRLRILMRPAAREVREAVGHTGVHGAGVVAEGSCGVAWWGRDARWKSAPSLALPALSVRAVGVAEAGDVYGLGAFGAGTLEAPTTSWGRSCAASGRWSRDARRRPRLAMRSSRPWHAPGLGWTGGAPGSAELDGLRAWAVRLARDAAVRDMRDLQAALPDLPP